MIQINHITREATVPFSIESVKAAIETVSKNSKAKCQIENKNDLMGSYSIALIGGLMVIIPVSIQLKKVGESETQINLQSKRAVQSINQGNNIVDNFLLQLSDVLSGQISSIQTDVLPGKIDSMQTQPIQKSKFGWKFYVFLCIFIYIAFYFLSKK